MVELGIHPRVMQGRAGHATSKLTMELYAHVPESADRRAAESLDRYFCDWKAVDGGALRSGGGRKPNV